MVMSVTVALDTPVLRSTIEPTEPVARHLIWKLVPAAPEFMDVEDDDTCAVAV